VDILPYDVFFKLTEYFIFVTIRVHSWLIIAYKEGKAIDGDIFRYKGQRYRIQQYNAPELGQLSPKKASRDLQRK